MSKDDVIRIGPTQEPIKMPKRDFFRLPEIFRCVFDGCLMVMVSERGTNTFVPVSLI